MRDKYLGSKKKEVGKLAMVLSQAGFSCLTTHLWVSLCRCFAHPVYSFYHDRTYLLSQVLVRAFSLQFLRQKTPVSFCRLQDVLEILNISFSGHVLTVQSFICQHFLLATKERVRRQHKIMIKNNPISFTVKISFKLFPITHLSLILQHTQKNATQEVCF